MAYISEQGDIILIDFNPQAGHEQQGRRPAYVISSYTFNKFTKMAIVCPITNTIKGFPLHVPLDERTKTTGVIMCEQAKSRKIVVDMCGLFIYNEDWKLPIIQIIRKLPKLLSYTTIMLL